MTDKQKALAGLGVASIIMPLLLILLFPLAIYYAWCEQMLWNWFVAGYLHLQPITLWITLGAGLLVRLFTADGKVVKGEEVKHGQMVIAAVSGHTFALLIGYVLHRCFVR